MPFSRGRYPAVGQPGMAECLGNCLRLPVACVPDLCTAVSSSPTGVDTMASYEEILHLLRYRNWHTRSLLDRKFKVVCSELNGRYVSNEFQVEVRAGLYRERPVAW